MSLPGKVHSSSLRLGFSRLAAMGDPKNHAVKSIRRSSEGSASRKVVAKPSTVSRSVQPIVRRRTQHFRGTKSQPSRLRAGGADCPRALVRRRVALRSVQSAHDRRGLRLVWLARTRGTASPLRNAAHTQSTPARQLGSIHDSGRVDPGFGVSARRAERVWSG
jgi:hypothetical protein